MTALNRSKQVNKVKVSYRIALLTMLCVLVTGTYSRAFAGSSVQSSIQSRQEKPDTIIVARDGSGDFTGIQKAIEATKAYPLNRWIIFIKNGVYTEQVRIPAWNPRVTLVGENRAHTIIRFGSYFGQVNKGRNSTFYTATVSIEATDAICKHLTIENTAGPVGQAIALSVSADRCLIEDCTINGHQDTFFATGAYTHVYLKSCLISGTTDFLFGDATVLLSYCTILCKADSYIVAASTPDGQSFGFVLDHCRLQAATGVKHVLLGRPWRPYAKTVYLNTIMGDFVAPVGWDNWRSKANESTAYYGEYKSYIEGVKDEAVIRDRARWSHQLTRREANKYTPESVLGKWVNNL
ncbi:pectinesterase family protein [Arachidicoccus terrestris]|uniref:pectinesterase family protein n=1 Tax=Arachidicoccus terrestris TaxID=2875539 RepID=UPI001CC3914A|nr:pectinesterase family protein [Arachidicoccus terrestris]UAY54537.1 pectin esterase [Arachidicoccus terrestris]